MAQHKGIDVSRYQGNIDWAKVKASGIEFAILRAGYGRYEHQVDAKFEEYYKGAKAVGLPIGCYWFSYARDPETAAIEANTCLKVLKGKTFELPVFYDIEGSALSTGKAPEKCKAFCDVIHKAGYHTGVYCSKSPLNKELKNFNLSYTWFAWVAFYSSTKPDCKKVDAWQYSSTGKVSGISGNVDMDIDYAMLGTLIKKPKTKKSISVIAQEVIDGKWGNSPNRKAKLEAAGYDYDKVQAEVNKLLKAQQSKPVTPKKSITEIANEVIAGKWGSGAVRKSKLKKAGYDYDKVQAEVNKILKAKEKAEKAKTTKKYVTVKKGDTMTSIAKANKTTLATLKKLNPTIKDINKIYVGQKIRVK